MTKKDLCFKAEIIDDEIFEIFAEEKKVFTVYVNKHESPSWIDSKCDECNEIARGIGRVTNIYLLRIVDATANVIKVDAMLLAQIAAAIMTCCSELYHDFICDACVDRDRQGLKTFDDSVEVPL